MLRWKRQRSLSRWPPAAYPESGPATIEPTFPISTLQVQKTRGRRATPTGNSQTLKS